MEQDAAWKRLFAHPLVVGHLLLGFAPEVAKLLDLGTLERLSASWVAAGGEQRHGDMAWRVWYADGSGRSLVLLIEFQSSVDGGMSIRVVRYEGMALDGLRTAAVPDRDGELRLLSVVVHSGTDRWTAPGGGARVAVDGDGEVWLPLPQRYLLVDSGGLPQDDAAKGNVVAAALWLGLASSSADALARLRELLLGWSAAGNEEAVDAVLEWFRIVLPRLLPDADPAAFAAWVRDLLNEEKGMSTLAERFREWEADLVHQGMEQGLVRGIEQGREQGIEQGLERGLDDQRAMLLRLAERKFDPATGRELARRLAGVTDAGRLARAGDWIIDCDTGVALLERFDNGRG